MLIGIITDITVTATCFRIDIKAKTSRVTAILLSVLRYIHQNPLKAKMVIEIGDYLGVVIRHT